MKFVPVSDVTGKRLVTTLMTTLKEFDLKYLRGQRYDGGISMSGQLNEVQTHVTKITLSYITCIAVLISLNLAISDVCGIQSIRNCTETIQKVRVFF